MISRRLLLGGLAWGAGFAASAMAPAIAVAQQKVTKTDAKYQDQPKGRQRCEICVNCQPRVACKLVEGEIHQMDGANSLEPSNTDNHYSEL
jgi:hypothetical protein